MADDNYDDFACYPSPYYPWYDYYENVVWNLSDQDIADDVMENIAGDANIPMGDTKNINVDVTDGIVTLSGTVRRRRSKWAAFNDAYWIPGVIDVMNNIKVEKRKSKGGK